ncbi:hypothetical protein SAMN05192534_110105 [Alteribacillus persepolensis]|uniref:ABC-2 type transport system permease protein n=1 Tax=Alteribacillus persepolensis TaxID=568899 RepID=A0A1G8EX55_9BACI|nr:hypothetical protein [Alteribacillus persepolensis]SDH74445.1 hypothetical protein SAMN05192534_110105 [Alteribacillus persepolensis]
MNSWSALIKKEFKLTKDIFFVGIALIFLVWGGTFLIEQAADASQGVMLAGMTAGVFMHFLYVPVYLFISMQKEMSTLPLWLHNPQPMYRLVSAKVASGVLCMIVSLLVNGVIVLFLIGTTAPLVEWPSVWETTLFSGIGGTMLITYSLYLSLYILLFFAIYLVIRNIFNKWTWLVMVVLFLGVNWIIGKVSDSSIYAFLTQWGEFTITFQTGVLSQMGDMFPAHFYAGTAVFHVVVMVLVFTISTLLIDRKAEV